MLTSQARLLENHPMWDASIRPRPPDIEPLNPLRVDMLKQYRAETEPRMRESIRLSINAIATALRNNR